MYRSRRDGIRVCVEGKGSKDPRKMFWLMAWGETENSGRIVPSSPVLIGRPVLCCERAGWRKTLYHIEVERLRVGGICVHTAGKPWIGWMNRDRFVTPELVRTYLQVNHKQVGKCRNRMRGCSKSSWGVYVENNDNNDRYCQGWWIIHRDGRCLKISRATLKDKALSR